MTGRKRAAYFTMLVAVVSGCISSGTTASSPAAAPAPERRTEVSGQAVPAEALATEPAARESASTPAPDSVSEGLRIAMETLALFGDSSVVVAPLGRVSPPRDTGSGPAAELVEEAPSWDIDVASYVTHDRVSHYIDLFTGSARERFATWLQRGKRYEPIVRAKFRERGIPEDMYYLGLVESGYDPHAVSRAYAVGMWQFMTATARGMGLRVDWWVDERRDPMKATDAAARFLLNLKDQFGSYYLAAAAYNGGPGRVSRGLARYADNLEETTGEDCFFALAETGYLRSETMNYVPQLIAAALIAKEPRRYGITLDSVPTLAYDSVRVPGGTSLPAVARAAGAQLGALRDLNPSILRGMTPPDVQMWVRVPVGLHVGFDSAFGALPDSARAAYRKVVSGKSQTLTSIAQKHGLTSRQLQTYNPKVKTLSKGRLRTGTSLLVPTVEVAEAAFVVPDPSIERYGTSTRGSRVHAVRRGETLGGIAKRYGTSVSTLMRLNGLKKPVIYAGQTIIVRGSTPSRAKSTARSVSSTKKSSAKKTKVAASSSKKSTASKSKPSSSSTKKATATAKSTSKGTESSAAKAAAGKGSTAKSATKPAAKTSSSATETKKAAPTKSAATRASSSR